MAREDDSREDGRSSQTFLDAATHLGFSAKAPG